MKKLALTLLSALFLTTSFGQNVINFKPSANPKEDMTEKLRIALSKVDSSKEVKLILEKGEYFFTPEYAQQQYLPITNHGNGLKSIIFNFTNLKGVEVEGNGAKLTFHGQVLPFFFQECSDVKVSNLSIDWDIPFLFQGEVVGVNSKEQWIDIKPYTKGYSWKLVGDAIKFPNIDGFNYTELGSTLMFEKETARVAYGAWDGHLNPRVKKMPNGVLRLTQKMRQYPNVGDVLNSKGNREDDRYAPAFDFKNSQNIQLSGVTVHHALGMGYLFEKSEDIKILGCKVVLPEGSDRVVSSTADATHFANCKGDILIENCRFENMLDDGTNVHGTYLVVDKLLAANKIRVKLMHFEQHGFNFTEKGDEMWFIHTPDPSRGAVAKVSAVDYVNETFMDITFEGNVPSQTKKGDVIENKTWNPVFTMRGCTIQNHRARNIILKTPLKIVIENNTLSSMMSAILFRGEMFSWYESGGIEDVLIRNNTFKYCAYSGSPHAVITVTPRFNKDFDVTTTYDKNIRIIDNTIENFESTIVWADRAEGLVIKNNTIVHTKDAPALRENQPLFELINCKDVEVTGNSYKGDVTHYFKADEVSKSTLKVKGNKGFKLK